MNLHVIIASNALVRPRTTLPPKFSCCADQTVALVDTSWLVETHDDPAHGVLLTITKDERHALARALRQDFGGRVEPALMFGSGRADWTGSVASLLFSLWAADGADGLVVHEFGIGPEHDPESCLEKALWSDGDDTHRLMMAVARAGIPDGLVTTSRTLLRPGDEFFIDVLLNAIAHRLTTVEIPSLIAKNGFAAAREPLAAAVRDELDSYVSRGLTPALPVTPIGLRGLAEAVLTWKFAMKATSVD